VELYEGKTPVQNLNQTLLLFVGWCEARLPKMHLPQNPKPTVGLCEAQLLYLQLTPVLHPARFGRWNELLRYLTNLILNLKPS
jgi:hypothetical protein